MDRPLITIGFDKNGDADFGVRCDIMALTIEQMNELRIMTISAISCAENMWRREQEQHQEVKDNGYK